MVSMFFCVSQNNFISGTYVDSNVIDFVMLSAQMVLMFFRLAGEAYFPHVTGMSRRQGTN